MRWFSSPVNGDAGAVGKVLPGSGLGGRRRGNFCTRWLQARRARSDAPYRAGLATGLFDFSAYFGVRVKPEQFSKTDLNPNSEVGRANSRKILPGSGLGRRRRGNFAPVGCRRGAHGVTRPTVLGSRRVFSISAPTDIGCPRWVVCKKVQPWRVSANPSPDIS